MVKSVRTPTEKVNTKAIRALGAVSILGSIYLGLSLLTYNKWDTSFLTFTHSPPQNKGGVVGAYISDLFISLIGISSYAIPVFLAIYGLKRLLLKERYKIHILGALLFIISFSSLSGLLHSSLNINITAGLIGNTLEGILVSGLSQIGAYILTIGLVLTSFILISPESFIDALLKPKEKEVVKTQEEEYAYEPDLTLPPLSEMKPEVDETPLDVIGVEEIQAEGSGYTLPDVELLRVHDAGVKPSKEEIRDFEIVEQKLKDFGIEGKVTNVHIGPVVTMYEFEPAPGVKIGRVISLSDDLALTLKAKSVRIAPISGKAAIGIEVPNHKREIVSLREIISSEAFKKSPSKLTLALGKDIFGNPVTADLMKMPHLLVAGATGSGKSVSINSMVVSILYKATPDEVKLLLIDPKLLELSFYEGIPHLISPVLTGPKEASEALRKIVLEMDRRYRVIAEKGARNIDGFNMAVSSEYRLPYIVVVIDELADLMFASANVVEDSIARLAQMARASGIHLIVATQRPSVDVITGIIKANFSTRISFQVSSKVDSRTILDVQGGEQLIGNGDMLFMQAGARIMRVHGSFVTESEIKAVTDFIRLQGMPDYSILEGIVEEKQEEKDTGERDELYQKAVEFGEAVGEVSISSIQRRFKIGYNRAARIMELMEEDGLVGPSKGAGKPRDFIRRGFRN